MILLRTPILKTEALERQFKLWNSLDKHKVAKAIVLPTKWLPLEKAYIIAVMVTNAIKAPLVEMPV